MGRVGPRKRRFTFKFILVVFMSAIIAVMTILLVVITESSNKFSNQLDKDLGRIVLLQNRIDEMDQTYTSLSNYAASGDDTYLREYISLSSELQIFVDGEQKREKNQEGYYLYYDLGNMFLSFMEQAERFKATYESGQGSVYVNDDKNDWSKNSLFVKEQLSRIISFELNGIEDKYGNIEEAVSRREEMVYFIVFLVIVITFVLGSVLANRLARPIHALSGALSLIGKGKYDSKPIEEGGVGEVAGIISDFNIMQSHLYENIELMHENANFRERLKNQEINLLASENHLKQSKLDFLQSQINPHFLYNTLNSIQTLADIEEAPQTEKMLEHLSSLMRYNVKKTNTVVRLGEELEVIDSYVYIQLIRFGDRIVYELDCEGDALNIQVPSMILQPLVENAMIHGLEPKMGQGILRISAKRANDQVTLKVRDNGLGMEQETIDKLMAYGEGQDNEDMNKNAKSIGVANVIRRCRLYYGKNVISIESVLGDYTEFTFRINVL